MRLLIVSIFACIAITAISLTSCSAEPHATLKEHSQLVSPTAMDPQLSTAQLTEFLGGEWICAPKGKCSYLEISVSEKDGSAELRTDSAKDTVKVSIDGNLRVNPENKHEILYKGERYIRKPVQSPSPTASLDASYVDVI